MKKILFSISISFFGTFAHASKHPILLVHGANFSAASWDLVQNDLNNDRIRTLAPTLYSVSERLDLHEVAQRLCQSIKLLSNRGQPRAVVVGHSQAGAILNEASSLCGERIAAFVYVAAVMPMPGEGVFDQLNEIDNQNYDRCASLNADTQVFELVHAKACKSVFMGDAPPPLASWGFRRMVAEPSAIGASKANYRIDDLRIIPKFYISTLEDRIISKQTQQHIMAHFSFARVYQIKSSHSPFLQHHRLLSQILLSIQGSVPRGSLLTTEKAMKSSARIRSSSPTG